MLRFLYPYLLRGELTDAIRLMYKGTLRVLLVLLHDFPEFLCDHHYILCDVIPPTCIQLRNLVLSAFPKNMRLPDPFTPNLKVRSHLFPPFPLKVVSYMAKAASLLTHRPVTVVCPLQVDLLPEISQPPRVLGKTSGAIQPLIPDLDRYVKSRTPPTFPATLKARLLLPPEAAASGDSQYNSSAINSLVIHVGMSAISSAQVRCARRGVPFVVNPRGPGVSGVTSTTVVSLTHTLAVIRCWLALTAVH